MNAPSAKADGFSGKLRGIPHALRLKPRSRAEFGQMQYHLRRRNVSVEGAAAFAAVGSLGERLDGDRAAFWAGLRRPAGIDQPDFDTGAFSLVSDMLGELVPRGVVDGLGEHAARQSDDTSIAM